MASYSCGLAFKKYLLYKLSTCHWDKSLGETSCLRPDPAVWNTTILDFRRRTPTVRRTFERCLKPPAAEGHCFDQTSASRSVAVSQMGTYVKWQSILKTARGLVHLNKLDQYALCATPQRHGTDKNVNTLCDQKYAKTNACEFFTLRSYSGRFTFLAAFCGRYDSKLIQLAKFLVTPVRWT